LVLTHGEKISKQCKDFNYIEELHYLVTNEKRNKFIYELCKRIKGNTLVLYQLVEKHGKILNNLFKSIGKEVHFVHGGIGTNEREQIRKLAEKKNNIIILASYGVFSTGINIRNLHNVVFASPYKSRIKVLQSIGRGLRKTEQKNAVKLYDISDDLSYNNKKNFTLLHFQERINIYNEEQFDYIIDKVNL
jgi:superfamily II DNA or RNA helicase